MNTREIFKTQKYKLLSNEQMQTKLHSPSSTETSKRRRTVELGSDDQECALHSPPSQSLQMHPAGLARHSSVFLPQQKPAK